MVFALYFRSTKQNWFLIKTSFIKLSHGTRFIVYQDGRESIFNPSGEVQITVLTDAYFNETAAKLGWWV